MHKMVAAHVNRATIGRFDHSIKTASIQDSSLDHTSCAMLIKTEQLLVGPCLQK
jgi:hypothetical protein